MEALVAQTVEDAGTANRPHPRVGGTLLASVVWRGVLTFGAPLALTPAVGGEWRGTEALLDAVRSSGWGGLQGRARRAFARDHPARATVEAFRARRADREARERVDQKSLRVQQRVGVGTQSAQVARIQDSIHVRGSPAWHALDETTLTVGAHAWLEGHAVERAVGSLQARRVFGAVAVVHGGAAWHAGAARVAGYGRVGPLCTERATRTRLATCLRVVHACLAHAARVAGGAEGGLIGSTWHTWQCVCFLVRSVGLCSTWLTVQYVRDRPVMAVHASTGAHRGGSTNGSGGIASWTEDTLVVP